MERNLSGLSPDELRRTTEVVTRLAARLQRSFTQTQAEAIELKNVCCGPA